MGGIERGTGWVPDRISKGLILIVGLSGAGCAGHDPRGLEDLADVRVLGHRGAAALGPENTLPAMQAAVDLGVGFEIDVTLSADGEVVVIHDDTVDRTTDGQGAVGELSLEALRALDAGAWFGEDHAGARIPTLGQVLDRFGGQVLVDIELKTGPDRAALAEGVVRAVRERQLEDAVVVTSFDPYLLSEVADRAPAIRRGQLTGTFRGADLNLLQKLVLRHQGLKRVARPDFVAVEHVRARRRYVRRWHRRGYPVLVWTVNDPARARELVENGVDGLITDAPDALLPVAGPGRQDP